MKNASLLLLSLFLMAMAPANEVKDAKSGHIGLGALQCSIIVSGFDPAGDGEMRQWLFGYLAAIDIDVFTLSQHETASRNKVERQIAKEIGEFVDDFCNKSPSSTVGDAMVALQRNYDADAWDRVLEGFKKMNQVP